MADNKLKTVNKRKTVSELMRESASLRAKEPYVTSQELGAVIDRLQKKGWTQKDIAAWLSERGHVFTVGGMMNGYRRWLAKSRKKKP